MTHSLKIPKKPDTTPPIPKPVDGVPSVQKVLQFDKNTKLYTQSWLPKNEPKANLLYIHGYADHGGRFKDFALQLNQHDFAVHALDFEGLKLNNH